MQPEANSQPISIVARRALRQNASVNANQPMSAARHAAYRQLALTVLGLDVPTLTNELRARRFARMSHLRLVPQGDCAA